MKNTAAVFLTEDEKNIIQNAVKEIEKTTSGEIVPMIVSYSYTYPSSNLIGGLLFGIIAGIAGSLILRNENMWLFLMIFIITLIVMHKIIESFAPLKRLFIQTKEIDEEVQEAATTAFYKNKLYQTRDETGVLIYISVFEREVWVLADKGINEKVGASAWQEIVDEIIKGIKEKKQGEAIKAAVIKAGSILQKFFPAKKDDTDELDNLIVGK